MFVARKTFIVPVAALAASLLCAGAVRAQERGRDRRSRDQQQSAPSQRPAQPAQREGRAAPRRDPAPRPAPRVEQAPAPRPENAPRNAPGRQGSQPNRLPNRGQYQTERAPQSRDYRPNVAVPRVYPNRPSGPREYSSRSSSYFAPRFFPRPLYRPYYAFQPRVRFGLGLYIGYPVVFPSWYDPYLSSAYSWYRPGMSYGGVSFDIQPYDAAIYVDGDYVGTVEDFGPYAAPLTLPVGRHHIDLESRGFAPLSFDITVVPRQVIPYQGTLPRY